MQHLFIKLLIIGFMLISCNVVSQDVKRVKILNGNFEKFEMKDYIDKRDHSVQGGDNLNHFFLKDSTEIYSVEFADEYTEEVILPKPSFIKLNRNFYLSGFIKCKGASFGDITIGASGIKIGKWYYFDEMGKLTKTEDEDLKFGRFGYQQVLNSLDKEGVISLKTGKNRDKLRMFFNENGQNEWIIEVATEFVPDNYSKGWKYTLEGNTGKVLKKSKMNINYIHIN